MQLTQYARKNFIGNLRGADEPLLLRRPAGFLRLLGLLGLLALLGVAFLGVTLCIISGGLFRGCISTGFRPALGWFLGGSPLFRGRRAGAGDLGLVDQEPDRLGGGRLRRGE